MNVDIYLRSGEANPNDIKLRNPTTADPAEPGGFPLQVRNLPMLGA